MRVISVVGARPQFVKLAPIARALEELGHDHVVVHTGQHYDERMSGGFLEQLGVREPDVNLQVGSGTHGAQTGAILRELEAILLSTPTDWVLAYGDTNSTVATALGASKLGIPVAHLEAGLRSFNRQMPEELNRVATDHLSDLLLAPTHQAVTHLEREGLSSRTRLVGDVMTDICLATRQLVTGENPPKTEADDWAPGFVLATLHRPANTDDPERLRSILDALVRLPYDVLLPAHPRLMAASERFSIDLAELALTVTPPLDYPSMIKALSLARGVVTDSGGLQKEAYLLRVPCTTVRSETEWVETLEDEWNVLVPDVSGLAAAVARKRPSTPPLEHYGTGQAALQACRVMASWSAVQ